jgi:hypothetical protein
VNDSRRGERSHEPHLATLTTTTAIHYKKERRPTALKREKWEEQSNYKNKKNISSKMGSKDRSMNNKSSNITQKGIFS